MIPTIQSEPVCKPFLRWAGGKNSILPQIISHLPQKIMKYHEPFLGGGALFFYLKQNKLAQKYYLSDLNSSLINTYVQIKKNILLLFNELRKFKNEERFYYKIRNEETDCEIKKAAIFLFFNKTSFNGIYRVNREGHYNVPFGFRKLRDLFDYENLLNVHELLQGVNISTKDFYRTLDKIQKNDLVFLDPPYTVMHENNGFINYNQKIFKWEDQERLAKYIKEIKAKKAYYILTNAKHKSIKTNFCEIGKPIITKRKSTIGGIGAKRGEIEEYIFTNVK